MEHRYTRGDIESSGHVGPQYEVVMRRTGQLACGDVAIEPALGPARVTALGPAGPEGAPSMHVTWSDDFGPCTAAGRYRLDQSFPVRIPARSDQLRIRRAIDQAMRSGQNIGPDTARHIAAHLHRGPSTALFGFARHGAVPDQLFDELEHIAHDQPAYRRWIDALAGHCLSQEDRDRVPGWFPATPEHAAPARLKAQRPPKPRAPLTSQRIRAETAVRLMDAAFVLGLAAATSTTMATSVRKRLRQAATRVA